MHTEHWHTWPPEKDELKVVFESPGEEHTLSEDRGSKSHGKEWFINHGNLEMHRKKSFGRLLHDVCK